ncbi:WXG100-like domain-containing protein [Streptacidiphilus sp. PAMC 29251]
MFRPADRGRSTATCEHQPAPELGWVARLAVGQAWPKGDEDKMIALGAAWNDAAQQLVNLSATIDPATSGVLNSIGGQVADQFHDFTAQLQSSLPDMADAAGQMGQLGHNTGVQLEYSKYMILAQLVWLAYELVQLAFWAPEAVPAAITAARLIVQMILKRLLQSVVMGVGFMVGMDVAIQTIQFLKGDRTKWDASLTLSAVESGAISGGIGGILHGVGGAFAPKSDRQMVRLRVGWGCRT